MLKRYTYSKVQVDHLLIIRLILYSAFSLQTFANLFKSNCAKNDATIKALFVLTPYNLIIVFIQVYILNVLLP